MVRLAFSPDSKQIATTERDSAVRLYDAESGKEIWSHVIELKNIFENYTSAIAFSPDGKTVAVCATDYRIYLLDTTTGKEVAALVGHHWYPWALAFTADGKMLYSSGWDGAVRRWDVAARKQLALPKGIHATCVVATSPDERTLAYQDDAYRIHLVDADDGAEQRTLELPGTKYSQLAFSPDSRSLAGGGSEGDSVHVTVWDLAAGKPVHRWTWPKGKDPHSTVECLSFTHDGKKLAAAVFRQSSAYLWNLETDKQISQIAHNQIYGLSFSPDGETLATAGWDSKVRFWDSAGGGERGEIDLKDPREQNRDLRMYTVCYAPEGGLFATAHLDGTVRVWHADDMTRPMHFGIVNRFIYGAMSFSPDGLWLATGAMDGAISLWDPLTGQNVWNHGRHEGYVYTVGFGRDSRTLVSGGDDGICYRWDLRPRGERSNKGAAELWDDLAGEKSQAAYQAMWELSDTPDRTLALVAEKLRPVTMLVDLDRIPAGTSDEDWARQKNLKTLLIDKDPEVERLITARRAGPD